MGGPRIVIIVNDNGLMSLLFDAICHARFNTSLASFFGRNRDKAPLAHCLSSQSILSTQKLCKELPHPLYNTIIRLCKLKN